MSTTQTKKLSEATVVQSVAEADKIPIVNSSGQTVLVPLSGLLGAIKVGARNLVRSTIYSASVPGARRTNGRIITADNTDNHRINLVHKIENAGYYAVSFWAKSSNGSKTFRIDINDCETPALKNLSVDSSWQFFSGVIRVSYNLGTYGFIDFFQADGVVISDLSVVEGSVPLQEWIPAPEDWGGVKTSLSAVCAFAAQLSAWKGGSHECYANEVLPRVDGKPDRRDFSRGLLRTMGKLRRRGTKEPQSAASSMYTEMQGCGYSRCRMDENGNRYGQYSDVGQWRISSNSAIRYGSDNATVLLMDDAPERLYPQEKFGVRKQFLGQLDTARVRSVAARKEVAV